MLHSVNDEVVEPIAPNNSIRPRELVALIERLLAARYTFQTLGQATRTPTPQHVVVLTFDDGFADKRKNLLPILQRFGIPASFGTKQIPGSLPRYCKDVRLHRCPLRATRRTGG